MPPFLLNSFSVFDSIKVAELTEKICDYFSENEFYRLGVNNYPKYKLLVNLLYYTGMRIGEVIALTYEDFLAYSKTPCGKKEYMRVNVTKSYNSVYKLLKGTKNQNTDIYPIMTPKITYLIKLLIEQITKKAP